MNDGRRHLSGGIGWTLALGLLLGLGAAVQAGDVCAFCNDGTFSTVGPVADCSNSAGQCALMCDGHLGVADGGCVCPCVTTCEAQPHWVDSCEAGGHEVLITGLLVGLDYDLDCEADVQYELAGTAVIRRGDPVDSTPFFGAPDGHLDVIEIEVTYMKLEGPGLTVIAGAGFGDNPSLPLIDTVQPSLGAMFESLPPEALEYVGAFFEVQADDEFLYNTVPIPLEGLVTEVLDYGPGLSIPGGTCVPLQTAPPSAPLTVNLVIDAPSLGGPAPVPDGTVGTPLRLSKEQIGDLTTIVLGWDTETCSGVNDQYKLLWGDLDQLPQQLEFGLDSECDLDPSGSQILPTWSTPSVFFMVVRSDGLGTDVIRA